MSEFSKILDIGIKAYKDAIMEDMNKSLWEGSLIKLIPPKEIVKDDEYWRQQNQKVIDTAIIREFSKKFDELRASYRGISLTFDECGMYADVGKSPSIIIADYYN